VHQDRERDWFMTWTVKNTTIPIPEVVAYDSSTENPIAHEFTLLSRVNGVTLIKVYQNLNDEQINEIID
jgi:hypothetical protein